MKQARAQSAGLLFFTTLQKIGCGSAKKKLSKLIFFCTQLSLSLNLRIVEKK